MERVPGPKRFGREAGKPKQHDESWKVAFSDSSSTAWGYQPVGMCGSCIRPIEAFQPGGLTPRHIDDKSQLCSKPKKENLNEDH